VKKRLGKPARDFALDHGWPRGPAFNTVPLIPNPKRLMRAGEIPVRRFLRILASEFRSANMARCAAPAKSARTRLSIEALEDRVTPTVIMGTSGNDTITMDVSTSGDVLVTVNGQGTTYSYSPGTSFEIDALGGSNTVNILQLPELGNDPIDTVTVNCQGVDNVTVGNDMPGGVYLVKGAVTINGNGKTSVSLDDSAYAGNFGYSVAANFSSWGGVDGSGLSFQNVANFTLNAGTGDNGINVDSTAAGTVYRINPGVGQNNVEIGSGTLGSFQGPLAVFGNGADTVDLFDSGGDTKASYNLTQNFISRPGFAGLTYGGIRTLTLYGTTEGDTYGVRSTAFGTSYVINVGGNDSINLGEGNVNELAGPMSIDGAGGNVRVSVDDHGNAFSQTFTLSAASVSPTDFFGGLTYSGLTSLNVIGGSGGNSFAVTDTPTTAVFLAGGSGRNTLTGPNSDNAWTILGQNSGRLGANVSFSSMSNLVGGSAGDTFAFRQRFLPFPTIGSISGSIQGGGGTNTLDYSTLSGPVSVNLGTHAASQIHGGLAGGFTNISRIMGSAAATDTLTGPNVTTDWVISSANAGKAGEVAFTGFENLVGGSGVDSFRFLAGGTLAGRLDGGLAPSHQGNWLDYSDLTSAVAVNLQNGSVTGVAGGASGHVSRIQNVHGSNGGNKLTGNSQGNVLIGGAGNDVLVGGSGRSILIGDAGSDKVTGRSGSDILIGDGTTFDAMTSNNQRSLMALLAEWQSADSYSTRFRDINTGAGGGLNGTAKLNFGTTVLDDGSADAVTGLVSIPALDWFFQGLGDELLSQQNGEHVNNN
jgi:hypothetical protein